MIFSVYGYKNYHKGNKELHPKGWNEMLKEDVAYTKSLNYSNYKEYEKYNINPVDLPSYHPYWRFEVIKDYLDETRKITGRRVNIINTLSSKGVPSRVIDGKKMELSQTYSLESIILNNIEKLVLR